MNTGDCSSSNSSYSENESDLSVVRVASDQDSLASVPDTILGFGSSPEWEFVVEDEHIPYPWEVSLAFTRLKTCYKDSAFDDAVTIMGKRSRAEDQGEASSSKPYPKYEVDGGPKNFYNRPIWLNLMTTEMHAIKRKYGLKEDLGFNFIKPVGSTTPGVAND